MTIELEQRVAILEAREQIKELRASYGWHASRGHREGVANLFEPDGVFELKIEGERRRHVGREAILDLLNRSMWPDMVFPVLHNHIIDVRGDEARGSCVMEARTKARVAEAFPNGFLGYYHDYVRRQPDGRWLFAERRWFFYHPQFEDSGLPMSWPAGEGIK